jgi:hypothetical protein
MDPSFKRVVLFFWRGRERIERAKQQGVGDAHDETVQRDQYHHADHQV